MRGCGLRGWSRNEDGGYGVAQALLPAARYGDRLRRVSTLQAGSLRHKPGASLRVKSEVVALAGGVGAARFLDGLCRVVPPASLFVIGNVADDTEIHGLHISPDLDTVMY